jgi:hypothetical protein
MGHGLILVAISSEEKAIEGVTVIAPFSRLTIGLSYRPKKAGKFCHTLFLRNLNDSSNLEVITLTADVAVQLQAVRSPARTR